MVTELLPLGSLRRFLKKQKDHILPRDLVHMAQNACAGLCYLSANGIVHRDIAARNFYVKQEDHQFLIKVAGFIQFKNSFINHKKKKEFGMSRSIDPSSGWYCGNTKKVPIKWTSPEALKTNQYTLYSDVIHI